MLRLENSPTRSLSRFFPSAGKSAIDLLTSMLKIDPTQRISVEGALSHPYLSALHNPNDEPVAGFDFDFSFEDEELDGTRVKELIWQEVATFREECKVLPRRKKSRK